MRISDWSSDVCSSDLLDDLGTRLRGRGAGVLGAGRGGEGQCSDGQCSGDGAKVHAQHHRPDSTSRAEPRTCSDRHADALVAGAPTYDRVVSLLLTSQGQNPNKIGSTKGRESG